MEAILNHVAEIDRQVVLTTSALQNLRNMMAKDSNNFIPTERHRWPHHMQHEVQLLRDRVDDLMGTVTLLLSMCSRNPIDGVNINPDDADLALASCARTIATGDLNVAAIESYSTFIADFIGDLIHGSKPVTSVRASEYYKKSLEISMMLVTL